MLQSQKIHQQIMSTLEQVKARRRTIAILNFGLTVITTTGVALLLQTSQYTLTHAWINPVYSSLIGALLVLFFEWAKATLKTLYDNVIYDIKPETKQDDK